MDIKNLSASEYAEFKRQVLREKAPQGTTLSKPRGKELRSGQQVRLKSGSQGWIKGSIVEFADVVPSVGGMIYTGPSYKVYILEGKHKGETIRVPANYVEAI